MSRFWNRRTAALSPYIPGEQPEIDQLVKLNTNEHALAPGPAVSEALRSLSPNILRRYPDPTARSLREAIAKVEGLSADQVHCGNGSDEVLALVFLALLNAEYPVSVPDITYSFYPVWAQLAGVALEPIALRSDFTMDIESMMASNGPLLFANPNAPTGIAVDRTAVVQLLASNRDRLVVVDEAYHGFGAVTAAPLIDEFDNLLITRTLSKSHALAGLRVGYALGHPALIEGLIRVKDSLNSYPLDTVAQRLGAAAIADTGWFADASAAVVASREALVGSLTALGFRVLPSAANFVFVEHGQVAGRALYDGLRERAILVRRWERPRIDNWLRITVGSDSEHRRLLAGIESILAENRHPK